jgi:6-phosphogluconolactonase
VTVDNFSRRQFLRVGGIGLLGAMASRTHAWSNQSRIIYVGTYTSGKSEGIYGYHFDTESGKLTRFTSISSINPSFLAIDRTKRYLYAVNELGQYAGKPGGAVSAYRIERGTGNLYLLNEQATQAADPCHLSIDNKKSALFVANYTGGSVSVMQLRSDGTVGSLMDFEQHHLQVRSHLRKAHAGPTTLCRASGGRGPSPSDAASQWQVSLRHQ